MVAYAMENDAAHDKLSAPQKLKLDPNIFASIQRQAEEELAKRAAAHRSSVAPPIQDSPVTSPVEQDGASEQRKKKPKQRRKKRRKGKLGEKARADDAFLEQEIARRREIEERLAFDIGYAETVLKGLTREHQKQAQRSNTDIFYKEVAHEGIPLRLVYDTHAWYIFTERFVSNNYNIGCILAGLQVLAKQRKVPVWFPHPFGEEDDLYLFSGVKPGSVFIFHGLVAAINVAKEQGITRELLLFQEKKQSNRKHPDASIEPEMGYGSGGEKDGIDKKRLAQLRELQRCAVPDGERKCDDKP